MDGDLYEILGVPSSADDNQIKKAYHKLYASLLLTICTKTFFLCLSLTSSLKYHPDKNPNAKELYNSIQHAYSILSDSEKRAEFDEVYRARIQRSRVEQLMSDRKKQFRKEVYFCLIYFKQ